MALRPKLIMSYYFEKKKIMDYVSMAVLSSEHIHYHQHPQNDNLIAYFTITQEGFLTKIR